MPIGPSGSTPVFGLPYCDESDTPDISVVTEQLATAVEDVMVGIQVPVGGVIDWYSDTLPAAGKWLFMHGQTVSEGAYPDLAAVYASWVSGSNIVLPDTRDRVTMGAGDTYTVSETGGSATVTLVAGNIPRFTGVSVSISDPGHSHPVNQSYASASPGSPHGDIEPTIGGGLGHPGDNQVCVTGGSGPFLAASGTTAVTFTTFDTITPTLSTTAEGTGISGTVTFGSTSPTAVSVVQPFISAHKIVRAG